MNQQYTLSEIKHSYGPKFHILSNQFLGSILNNLSQANCKQPELNHLMELLYQHLTGIVVAKEFKQKEITNPTRMTAKHPGHQFNGMVIDKQTRAVVVDLARAGTLPSHCVYSLLNYCLNPDLVRQDHIMASRTTNDKNQVTGSSLWASKIGGDIDQAIVIIPDPMGATGSTIVSTVEHYSKTTAGKPIKFIAMHLIVTPEYLKLVKDKLPEVEVYALRLDRGLSTSRALQAEPGLYWSEEKGLDENQYIVPGAGGLGELLNNSFV
jgi:uracil phosphoribosyltransferase